MDGSGDNPQILQIPVHLPGYYQRFTWIFPAFYPDITSVLPGYSQRFTRTFPVFGQNMVFLPSLSSRSIDSEH